MIIKIHKTYRDVVAICDFELLGKVFEQGKFQLDLKESFFGGDKTTSEQAVKILQDYKKEDATFNIVGKKAINVALEAGIISEDGIKKISEIPFALVLV